MINFSIEEKFPVKPETELGEIKIFIGKAFPAYFDSKTVLFEPGAVCLNGSLKPFYEEGVIEAKARIRVEDGILFCRIEGKIAPGRWTYSELIAGGLFLFGGPDVRKWCIILLGLAGLGFLRFFISQNRPRQHFNEILKSLKFQFGA